MTADNARTIADAYVVTDKIFSWEFVEARFIDDKMAAGITEHANKWVIKYKAYDGQWNPATKLVVVDDKTGEFVDWGC